jgi:3-oxoacid CoA-transferase
VLIGGFGVIQGWPTSLLTALRQSGSRDLTVILNSPGVGPTTPQMLAENGQIARLIATFAAYPTRRTPIEEQIRNGTIALEMVPQGTLVERLRAGGAGLAAVYTPTGVGTPVADGKRCARSTAAPISWKPLRADRSARARAAYSRTWSIGVARAFNPVFATARTTIARTTRSCPPARSIRAVVTRESSSTASCIPRIPSPPARPRPGPPL